ncbi:FadR/GntR family transcriptional regulator [Paenibacillus nasutitermitis]|uniref:GntR family transcriptional regulator n=1 Tax=Paenibacillus nasutitermitis TaxID=1652958 RepID=A0A916YR31_9BACL|nr:FadR/GntR family transcriptional regulator [Paenibacillus nasutitermitis]GGD56395.1 GntR family transcriptional regulator [Paenibacillus nasutitermitis]
MKPLKRMSLKDVVIRKLHDYIAEHGLQPGDRFLNEKEIVHLVGASRTVVREALKAMEAVGVVRIKPGDGVFVNESSVHHLVNQFSFRWSRDRTRMLELLETRTMLELSAIELIVMRRCENQASPIAVDFREIDANLEQMERAIQLKKSLVEDDIEFHRTLFRMTGNRTFYELSEVITQYFNEVRERRISEADGYGSTFVEHARIVQLLKQSDAEGAKKAMIDHLSPLKEMIANGR